MTVKVEMLTYMMTMKRIETHTLKCRDIYHDVDSGVDYGIGSGKDQEVQLEIENYIDSENARSVGKYFKDEVDMIISDSVG